MSEAALACLCINCSEMIDFLNFDSHSVVCTRVSEEVLSADGDENTLQFVHLRICKLQNFLQRSEKKNQTLQSSDQNYIKALLRLLQQLIDTPTSQSTQGVIKSLASLKSAFSDHSALMDPMLLYAERVRHVALDQDSAVKTQELKKKLEEVRDLQQEAETEKLKVQLWQKVVKRSNSHRQTTKVEPITSKVGSLNSASESGVSSPLVDDIAFSFPDGIKDSSHRKRRFFALGIAAKLALPTNNPGLAVSLPQLYTKALHLGVPMEYWMEYIQMGLKKAAEGNQANPVELTKKEVTHGEG